MRELRCGGIPAALGTALEHILLTVASTEAASPPPPAALAAEEVTSPPGLLLPPWVLGKGDSEVPNLIYTAELMCFPRIY